MLKGFFFSLMGELRMEEKIRIAYRSGKSAKETNIKEGKKGENKARKQRTKVSNTLIKENKASDNIRLHTYYPHKTFPNIFTMNGVSTF